MHICFAWWWKQDELCERTKVQGELENALELASTAAVMKNQFLANMSHEVGRERERERLTESLQKSCDGDHEPMYEREE